MVVNKRSVATDVVFFSYIFNTFEYKTYKAIPFSPNSSHNFFPLDNRLSSMDSEFCSRFNRMCCFRRRN